MPEDNILRKIMGDDRSIAAASMLMLSLIPGALSAQGVTAQQLATTVDDGFTIAVVGDIIIAYPLDHMLTDPDFRAVVALTQGADVTTGNLEGNIIAIPALNLASESDIRRGAGGIRLFGPENGPPRLSHDRGMDQQMTRGWKQQMKKNS